LHLVLVDAGRTRTGVLLDDREQVTQKRAFFVVERCGGTRRLGGLYLVDRRTVETRGDRGHRLSLARQRTAKARRKPLGKRIFAALRGHARLLPRLDPKVRARLCEPLAVRAEGGRELEICPRGIGLDP